MKVVHRKSAWMHAVFSALLCAVLLAIVLIRRDIPTVLLVLAFGLYIAGNTFIHIKRKDYSREVLYEYLLLGTAVLVVLLSALESD